MQWNLTTTLVVIGFFLVGYAAGLIEMHLRRARKIRQLQEALKDAQSKPQAESAPASAPVQGNPSAPGKGELLRAGHDESGKLWLEMDAARFENQEPMPPEQRRRLVNLVLELRPWLDASQVAAPRPPVQTPAAVPVPPLQKTVEPVRPTLVNAFTALTGKASKDETVKVEPKSIVAQIDDVLQAILVNTVFKDQDIHLLEGAGGVVLVQVGGNKYDGIDAVPNPEVKGLIRQAVAAWEKRTG